MQPEYHKKLPCPFVVSKDQLEKLTALLQKHVGGLQITADCAGDVSSYKLDSLDELMELENSKGKEILNLTIKARSKDGTRDAIIQLPNTWSDCISVVFHVPDDVIDQLRAKMLEIISGMRPWYNFIHNRYLTSIMSLLSWVVVMGWCAMTFPHVDPPKNQTIFFMATFLVLAGVVACRLAMGSIVIKIRNWFFPLAVFILGQGKTRFEYMEKWRWVVVGLAVSLLVGIIKLLLQNLQGPK